MLPSDHSTNLAFDFSFLFSSNLKRINLSKGIDFSSFWPFSFIMKGFGSIEYDFEMYIGSFKYDINPNFPSKISISLGNLYSFLLRYKASILS